MKTTERGGFRLGIALVFLVTVSACTADRDESAPTTPAPLPSTWQAYPLFSVEKAAREGLIRIGTDADGLVVRGEVDGPAPQWPFAGEDMSLADRVEFWLADGVPAVLPPIGWGNQFGSNCPASLADCVPEVEDPPDKHRAEKTAQWQAWYQVQEPYRAKVADLFLRHWSFAPGRCEETAATTAYAALSPKEQHGLAALVPRGMPTATFTSVDAGHFGFELHIPWESFPPVRSLAVQDLRLNVAIGSRLGRRATISRNDLIPFPLPMPHLQTLTACHCAIGDAEETTNESIPYIRPTKEQEIEAVVLLDNTALGYQYDPFPDSRSPIAEISRLWSRSLGSVGMIGGPDLVWIRGDTTMRSDIEIDDPAQVDIHGEANGDILVMDGPRVWWTAYGSGQDGADPRIAIDIYRLNKVDQSITQLLTWDAIVEDDDGGDIDVSADWRSVDCYSHDWDTSAKDWRWSCTTFRFDEKTREYKQEPPRPSEAPPMPRRLKPWQTDAEPANPGDGK